MIGEGLEQRVAELMADSAEGKFKVKQRRPGLWCLK